MEPNYTIWLQNLRDERDGAALYDGLASLEKDPERARSFRELAVGERRHAEVWAKKLERAGQPLPPEEASPRIKTVLWLARRFGVASMLPLVMQTESGDADKYARQGGDATELAAEEREHRQVLVAMRAGAASGPAEAGVSAGGVIARRERWHRGGKGGSIRAAVFGMNDGLVSNLSLVLGVAGAGVGPETIVVTGVAGLLAGACSMAAGEYISVASERDLLKRQVDLERRELAEAPEEEAAELAEIFEQKGLSKEQARRTSKELLQNPASALDTLVREELGLDPGDLGSPLGAASSSFAMFAVGAFLPLLPFLLTRGSLAVMLACAIAGTVLAAVGGMLGFLAGTSPVRSAARMVGLATVAAAVTYGLGRLFGTTLS